MVGRSVDAKGRALSRSVVVTGGAGAIGLAVMDRFRALGDSVQGLDLREQADVVACDVADEGSVADAFAEVRKRQGPVEVLVHSAGITGKGTVTDEDPETWRRILEVNLTSAYLCCREAIPDMATLRRGRIVLIASVNGRFGGSALSGPAYAVSKGGLLTLARFLAREHAAQGITVNAVAPGPHDTPMWTALDAERRERILGMIPGGEGPGDPADLAATVVHLCSPEARYINGATIDVNGGQWMG
jgi:NAD(P)-dependent dehydrogenase (short-subunit alcohol dehydrogenase family)